MDGPMDNGGAPLVSVATARTLPANAWNDVVGAAMAIVDDERLSGPELASGITRWADSIAVLVTRSVDAGMLGSSDELAGVLAPDLLEESLRRCGSALLNAQVGWNRRPDPGRTRAAVQGCVEVIVGAIPRLETAARHRAILPDVAAVDATAARALQAQADGMSVLIPAASIVGAARLLVRRQLPPRVEANHIIALMRRAARDALGAAAGSFAETRRALGLAGELLEVYSSTPPGVGRADVIDVRQIAQELTTALPDDVVALDRLAVDVLTATSHGLSVEIPAETILGAARLIVRDELPPGVGGRDVIALMRRAAMDAADARSGSVADVGRALALARDLLGTHPSAAGSAGRPGVAAAAVAARGLETVLPAEAMVPEERPEFPDQLPTSAWPGIARRVQRVLLECIGIGGDRSPAQNDFTWWVNALWVVVGRAVASGYRPLVESAISTLERTQSAIERALPFVDDQALPGGDDDWDPDTALHVISEGLGTLRQERDALDGAHLAARQSLGRLEASYQTTIDPMGDAQVDWRLGVALGLLDHSNGPPLMPTEGDGGTPSLTDLIQRIAIRECLEYHAWPLPMPAKLRESLAGVWAILRHAEDALGLEFPERRRQLEGIRRRLGPIQMGLNVLCEVFEQETRGKQVEPFWPDPDATSRHDLIAAAWGACSATLDARISAADVQTIWDAFRAQVDKAVSFKTVESRQFARAQLGLDQPTWGVADVIDAAAALAAPALPIPGPAAADGSLGVAPPPGVRTELSAVHERLVAESARLRTLATAGPTGLDPTEPGRSPVTEWQPETPPPGAGQIERPLKYRSGTPRGDFPRPTTAAPLPRIGLN